MIESGSDFAALLRRRQKITDVLAQPDIDAGLKAKLLLTQDAKHFGEKKMGLKKTRNYLTYVQLPERYVSAIVSASKKCKLDAYTWSFPIVGKVPYLGFATMARAQQEAQKLEVQDYDTSVRETVAFSTLGWFEDPVVSSMLQLNSFEIVNTILHETVHATLFIKSSADFNEALATFWAQKGTEDFFTARDGANSDTLKQAQNDSADEKLFSEFITGQIKDLTEWYKGQGESCNLEERAKRLAEIQAKFQKDVQPKLKTQSYGNFAKGPLNNAKLAALKTYFYDLSLFEKLWLSVGRDHHKFLAEITKLKSSSSPFDDLKKLTMQ